MTIKSPGFGFSQTGIQILAVPLTGCVIFEKSFKLSEPQFLLSIE